jgi:hypothetical protein
MISPTMSPWTVISASHSGQCAICCIPPSNLTTLVQANKNALHPSFWEGRRAINLALVVPPSFVDLSRHQPRRVQTYSSLITEASGLGLLSLMRFLLAAPGFYSRLVDIRAFHQPLALCMQPEPLLVPSKLLLYSVVSVLITYSIYLTELSRICPNFPTNSSQVS